MLIGVLCLRIAVIINLLVYLWFKLIWQNIFKVRSDSPVWMLRSFDGWILMLLVDIIKGILEVVSGLVFG